MSGAAQLLCALDSEDPALSSRLAASLKGRVDGIKVGLTLFNALGPSGVREIAGHDLAVFLDLKFHDIPDQVGRAVAAAARAVAPFMLTVHAGGGRAMMQAAVAAARAAPKPPLVVAVTVLTSLDQTDLDDIGWRDTVPEAAVRLARLAEAAGVDGVVCSGQEIAALRRACRPGFRLVVPGIRPAGSITDDQKRTLTPMAAVREGADYLVVGRPITGAADPAQATLAIRAEMQAGQ